MEMGCYGIGITRIVAAAIEQNHDDKGIIWPVPMQGLYELTAKIIDLIMCVSNLVARQPVWRGRSEGPCPTESSPACSANLTSVLAQDDSPPRHRSAGR